mmetsp:Transcript_4029/g.14104  ORF Transcript_4029/g.14104 Transcript_4029/m.14104 type:complete len:386 (+) Transcript_4029:82-1239(+)
MLPAGAAVAEMGSDRIRLGAAAGPRHGTAAVYRPYMPAIGPKREPMDVDGAHFVRSYRHDTETHVIPCFDSLFAFENTLGADSGDAAGQHGPVTRKPEAAETFDDRRYADSAFGGGAEDLSFDDDDICHVHRVVSYDGICSDFSSTYQHPYSFDRVNSCDTQPSSVKPEPDDDFEAVRSPLGCGFDAPGRRDSEAYAAVSPDSFACKVDPGADAHRGFDLDSPRAPPSPRVHFPHNATAPDSHRRGRAANLDRRAGGRRSSAPAADDGDDAFGGLLLLRHLADAKREGAYDDLGATLCGDGGDGDLIEAPPAADAAPLPGYVGAYSPAARRERIAAYLEKRCNRVWTKRVKYDVRKNFADSRMRVKGRFVKKEDEDLLRELVSCI